MLPGISEVRNPQNGSEKIISIIAQNSRHACGPGPNAGGPAKKRFRPIPNRNIYKIVAALFLFSRYAVIKQMPATAENFYRGEAGHKYQQRKRAVPERALPWVCRLRAEKFQPYIHPTDTVLELGIGLGWNLAELQCARKIGTDLENHLPEAIQKAVEFHTSTEAIPSESIDVIICHHVLEHVEKPTEMLAESRRLLKPGGALLLHVPFEKERRYRHFDPADPNHHLYSWNVQTLGNLVTAVGFEITNSGVTPFGYDRFAANLALKLNLGEFGFRMLRKLALTLKPANEVRLHARK